MKIHLGLQGRKTFSIMNPKNRVVKMIQYHEHKIFKLTPESHFMIPKKNVKELSERYKINEYLHLGLEKEYLMKTLFKGG